MSNEYFLATTMIRLSKQAAARLNKKLHALDPTMDFTGPVAIPGNILRGWISRPNDGTNDHLDRKAVNNQAKALLVAEEQKAVR